MEDPRCIKIGYSKQRGAESREGSSTLAESVWVFFGTVIIDSDWLTKFFMLDSDWLPTRIWFWAKFGFFVNVVR